MKILSFNSRLAGLLLVVLISAITLYQGFKPMILAPNDTLYNMSGDGLKNYYTSLYHFKYGNGMQFEGMFYPYGTHVLFTDAQPALIVATRFLTKIYPPIANHYLAIFNMIILFSFLLASIYIYKIGLELGLPSYFAVLVTIPILFLSPQQYRISGHYGLALISVLPMFFYWLMRYEKNTKKRYLLYLFVLSLFTAFIHAYYLGVFIITLFFYSVVKFLVQKDYQNFSFKNLIRKNVPLILLFFCYILFSVFMKFTDAETDRVEVPYGHIAYRVTIEGLFIPLWGPIFDFINRMVRVALPGYEAYSYLGLPVSLFFISTVLYSVYRLIQNRFSKKKEDVTNAFFAKGIFHSTVTKTWFYVSLLILFLAMAIPFRLNSLWFVEFLPAIKQFRSLGRLAWVFYYLQAFIFAVFIWNLYSTSSQHNRKKSIIFLSACMMLWYYDAYIHYTGTLKLAQLSENRFNTFILNPSLQDSLKKYHPQAILCSPTFFVGTDKIGADPIHELSSQAMFLSYTTGIPMVDAQLARMPVGKSRQIWSMSSSPLLLSEVWEMLNEKIEPVLILQYDLAEDKNDIVRQAKIIFKENNFSYYILKPGDIIQRHLQSNKEILKNLSGIKKSATPAVYLSYEENTEAEQSYVGKGAYKLKGANYLYNGQLPEEYEGDSLEISFWVWENRSKMGSPTWNYRVYDANKNLRWEKHMRTRISYDIDKDWQRYSAIVPGYYKSDSISVEVNYSSNTWVDEFMIRRVSDTIFYKDPLKPSVWIYNNYRMKE